ncbi:hypothetical protein, partial [Bacteroides heparinolyticus]|uniref:hypothetical protein n=1 Tax=Prevotella heparinolytica TaxID=28113 RepID=UPI0035A0EBE2
VRDRRLLFLKMRGCILSGGYFLNAPVHDGQAEEKKAFQTGRPSPVLTAAILCLDRRKYSSRQTQVSDVSDTCV